MFYYIKAMYDAWCNGQSDFEKRYKVFISIASRHLCRTPEEIETYLKQQSWFKHSD